MSYEEAKKRYTALGTDPEAAIEKLKKVEADILALKGR